MKYIWEEKDIKCGRYVNFGEKFSAQFVYQIGYIGGSSTYEKPNESNNYIGSGVCLICLADGLVDKIESKQELVKYLNMRDAAPITYLDFLAVAEAIRERNF